MPGNQQGEPDLPAYHVDQVVTISKRPSVFERLGNRVGPAFPSEPTLDPMDRSPNTLGSSSRKHDDGDLRLRMRNNRPESPQCDHHRDSGELSQRREEDAKVKSAVGLFKQASPRKTPEMGDDDDELERKHMQVKRELELELEREKLEMGHSDPPKVSEHRRKKHDKSTWSPESGSCTTTPEGSGPNSPLVMPVRYRGDLSSKHQPVPPRDSSPSWSHSSRNRAVPSPPPSHARHTGEAHPYPHGSPLSESRKIRHPTPPHLSSGGLDPAKYDRHGNLRVSLRDKVRLDNAKPVSRRSRSPDKDYSGIPIKRLKTSSRGSHSPLTIRSDASPAHSSHQSISREQYKRHPDFEDDHPRDRYKGPPDNRRYDLDSPRHQLSPSASSRDRSGDRRGGGSSGGTVQRPGSSSHGTGVERKSHRSPYGSPCRSYQSSGPSGGDYRQVNPSSSLDGRQQTYGRDSSPSSHRRVLLPSKPGRASSVCSNNSTGTKRLHLTARPIASSSGLRAPGHDRPFSVDKVHLSFPVTTSTESSQKVVVGKSEKSGAVDGPTSLVVTSLAIGDVSPISNFSDFEEFDNDEAAKREGGHKETAALVINEEVDKEDDQEQRQKKKSSLRGDDDEKEEVKGRGHEPAAAAGEDENFSDWSEDDELLKFEPGTATVAVTSADEGSITVRKHEDQRRDQMMFGHQSSRTDGRGASAAATATTATGSLVESGHSDDDLLDPVSDDDLDAILGDDTEPVEARGAPSLASQKRILDSLEIDWASLISQSTTKTDHETHQERQSARERVSAANVLSQIGFSQVFAGEAVSKEVIAFCQRELGEKFEPFFNPVASIHCYLKERRRERANLFEDNENGLVFSTALSARKDMRLRKLLSRNTTYGSSLEEAATLSDHLMSVSKIA